MFRRSLIALHRWLGVALALNFFLWFLSGIGMMYWDFPSVSAADRLARSPTLNRESIQLSVADAFKAADLRSADEVRLDLFDGRPVYRFRDGRTLRVVYADAPEIRGTVSRDQVDRIAAAWVKRNSADASVRMVDAVDQWTVQLQLTRLKPVWQYSWSGGEQVYVSQASGEVVQYTTRGSRFGAYVGAIPHWLYVTALRKNGLLWSRIVIGLSAAGTFAAALGLTIGIWAFSPSGRYRRGAASVRLPFRGWKRWHAVLGLIVGIAALTWAFSGMLSMDPFPLPGDPPQTDEVADALRGTIQAEAFERPSLSEVIAALGGLKVRQVELISFGGRSFYLVTINPGDTRIVDVSAAVHASFDTNQIASLVAAAVRPAALADTRLIDRYDRYYLDRHQQRPLPVVLVRLGDRDATRFYIDPRTAQLVGTYSARNWVTRWLYHGLHSFDFPWLYRYRPLWDVVVGAFMVAGSALCFTSLVLAWQVLGRTLAVISLSRKDR